MTALRSPDTRRNVFQKLGGFVFDTAATTAVEFGLVLLPFLILLGATVDVAMLYFRATELQMVTERFGREYLVNRIDRFIGAKRGDNLSQLDHKELLEKYVCTWKKNRGVVDPGTLSKMFDCDQLILSVASPGSWRRSSMKDDFPIAPQSGRPLIPAENSIAVIRIVYPIDFYFNFLWGITSSMVTNTIALEKGKTRVVMGIAAFRVEPGAAQD
jgi:hypothetical protein